MSYHTSHYFIFRNVQVLLTSITVDGRKVKLAESYNSSGSNVVTVLMGSNGCGKSRLFQAVCSSFIKSFEPNGFLYNFREIDNLLNEFDDVSYIVDDHSYFISKEKRILNGRYDLNNNGYVEFISHPPYDPSKKIIKTNLDRNELPDWISEDFQRKVDERRNFLYLFEDGQHVPHISMPATILAVTGSPYDKFPFSNSYSRSEIRAPYVYLGSRPKRQAGARLNRSYLSFKFDQLGASFIKLLLKPKQEYVDFSVIFDVLGLSSKFDLKLTLNERVREEQLTEDKVLEMVRGVRFFKDKEHNYDFTEEEKKFFPQRILKAIDYVFSNRLAEHEHHFNPVEVSCSVDLNGKHDDIELFNDLALLSEFDLIDLEDVKFKKRNTGKYFLLSQASSGELSLLFTMSSIAGEIKDNSLILLDEPELSLNPEWQLKFLPLLLNVFSKYKNCHFIVATHSPNIVSTIPEGNAYIVDLSNDSYKLYPSSKYHNRSADYQLAMLFKSPGFKNEFLISESIDILNKLSQPFSESYEKIQELKERAAFMFDIRMYLSEDDPVKRLIDMIERALEVIQRDY